jgi:hypothetical protein
MSRNTFRTRGWLPATRRAGLTGVRIHELRHAHASWQYRRRRRPQDRHGPPRSHPDSNHPSATCTPSQVPTNMHWKLSSASAEGQPSCSSAIAVKTSQCPSQHLSLNSGAWSFGCAGQVRPGDQDGAARAADEALCLVDVRGGVTETVAVEVEVVVHRLLERRVAEAALAVRADVATGLRGRWRTWTQPILPMRPGPREVGLVSAHRTGDGVSRTT